MFKLFLLGWVATQQSDGTNLVSVPDPRADGRNYSEFPHGWIKKTTVRCGHWDASLCRCPVDRAESACECFRRLLRMQHADSLLIQALGDIFDLPSRAVTRAANSMHESQGSFSWIRCMHLITFWANSCNASQGSFSIDSTCDLRDNISIYFEWNACLQSEVNLEFSRNSQKLPLCSRSLCAEKAEFFLEIARSLCIFIPVEGNRQTRFFFDSFSKIVGNMSATFQQNFSHDLSRILQF